MEKKKYFVVYGDFGNQYKLFWTLDSGISPNAPDYMRKFNTAEFLKQYPEAQRITRKEAIRLAREERERRRTSPSFAYYADKDVVPYGAAWYDEVYSYLHTDTSGVVINWEVQR